MDSSSLWEGSWNGNCETLEIAGGNLFKMCALPLICTIKHLIKISATVHEKPHCRSLKLEDIFILVRWIEGTNGLK